MNKETHISAQAKHAFPTKNGVIAEDNLRMAKENTLFSALRRYSNLVTSKQDYPEGNQAIVHLDLNIVVMTKARYDELVETEEIYKALSK